MNDSAIKKYSADKIGLLGLLVFALAVARVITFVRTTVPMRAGAEAAAAVKSRGLEDILDEQGWEAYYFVKDGEGRLVGFVTETFERAGSDANSTITSKFLFSLPRLYFQQHILLFECDRSVDTFRLEHHVRAMGKGASVATLSLDESGTVTGVSSEGGQKISFEAEKGSVPEYLIERVAVAATRGRKGQLVLNVIRSDGTQDVVVVSTEKTGHGSPRMVGSGRMVEIHSPEQQSTIQVLLDGADRIVEIVSQDELTFVQVRATREDIIHEFGEFGLLPEADEAPERESI
jgi:hypothetical protein